MVINLQHVLKVLDEWNWIAITKPYDARMISKNPLGTETQTLGDRSTSIFLDALRSYAMRGLIFLTHCADMRRVDSGTRYSGREVSQYIYDFGFKQKASGLRIDSVDLYFS